MKIISNYFINNNNYSTNFNRLNSSKNKINFCGIDENSNKDSFVKTDNSYIADKIMSEHDQLDLFTNSDEDIKIIDCKKDEDGRDIIEIMSDDEIYKFKGVYSDIQDAKNNASEMIENINMSLHGKFIQDGKKEVFIPYILGRTPDIKRDQTLIMNGNSENGQEIDIVREKLEDLLDTDIDDSEIKTIKYLIKHKRGYDNNIVKKAYGYYDKDEDVAYLYIPGKEKLQQLLDNGYVKSYYI